MRLRQRKLTPATQSWESSANTCCQAGSDHHSSTGGCKLGRRAVGSDMRNAVYLICGSQRRFEAP